MNHPKKLLFAAAILSLALQGCGDSKKEQAAKERERQRIEAERQAQAEAAKANKAITTNNQKMFSRMNSSGPGASTAKEPTPATPQSPPDKK